MEHKLHLSIRATNGASWDTDQFGSNQRVDHVRRAAERHFIEAGEMAAGDYVLALVSDGTTHDLVDAEKLEDAAVTDGSVLVLKVRGPQVDG
jgi:hypothetical protein